MNSATAQPVTSSTTVIIHRALAGYCVFNSLSGIEQLVNQLPGTGPVVEPGVPARVRGGARHDGLSGRSVAARSTGWAGAYAVLTVVALIAGASALAPTTDVSWLWWTVGQAVVCAFVWRGPVFGLVLRGRHLDSLRAACGPCRRTATGISKIALSGRVVRLRRLDHHRLHRRSAWSGPVERPTRWPPGSRPRRVDEAIKAATERGTGSTRPDHPRRGADRADLGGARGRPGHRAWGPARSPRAAWRRSSNCRIKQLPTDLLNGDLLDPVVRGDRPAGQSAGQLRGSPGRPADRRSTSRPPRPRRWSPRSARRFAMRSGTPARRASGSSPSRQDGRDDQSARICVSWSSTTAAASTRPRCRRIGWACGCR